MISFKGRQFEKDIILQCVRWYLAYALSYRDLEEMMTERGIPVDHSTIQRWVVKYSVLSQSFSVNEEVSTSWILYKARA